MKVIVWFFSAVSTKLSNIACRSGPDTIFSIKTGITTLVTNSIKILFFQLHPFRAEFWGYCALICSALRLMRAGWLTLVPPCPPPGNNTGRGKCEKNHMLYNQAFSSSWFLLSLKQEQDSLHYWEVKSAYYYPAKKITFFKFPVRISKGAEGGGVCPHVLMSPIVVWRAAECWLLSVAWLGAVRVYHNRMSQPLSAKTVNEPLRNCHI